jgi:hypothetical protein
MSVGEVACAAPFYCGLSISVDGSNASVRGCGPCHTFPTPHGDHHDLRHYAGQWCSLLEVDQIGVGAESLEVVFESARLYIERELTVSWQPGYHINGSPVPESHDHVSKRDLHSREKKVLSLPCQDKIPNLLGLYSGRGLWLDSIEDL